MRTLYAVADFTFSFAMAAFSTVIFDLVDRYAPHEAESLVHEDKVTEYLEALDNAYDDAISSTNHQTKASWFQGQNTIRKNRIISPSAPAKPA